MSDDHTLTLTAVGRARFETDGDVASETMSVTRSRTEEISAELALDSDRLYNSDIATTHKHGATIVASDVADLVAEALDADPVEPREWELTVAASLDDWQKVVLMAAEERRTFDSDAPATAIDVLLTLHEQYAETDRPLCAALNIDETYDVGRRDEILEQLTDSDDVDHASEVAADA